MHFHMSLSMNGLIDWLYMCDCTCCQVMNVTMMPDFAMHPMVVVRSVHHQSVDSRRAGSPRRGPQVANQGRQQCGNELGAPT